MRNAREGEGGLSGWDGSNPVPEALAVRMNPSVLSQTPAEPCAPGLARAV